MIQCADLRKLVELSYQETINAKVMGFGVWKTKTNWPVRYLCAVKELKVFGFYLMDSYLGLLQRNWAYRYTKFEQSIYSWSMRNLPSLIQKIDVVKIFALSRVYYIASVLPLSKTMSRKFEKTIGKFIWASSGQVLKVALHDLKLPFNRGGLKLPCVFIQWKRHCG